MGSLVGAVEGALGDLDDQRSVRESESFQVGGVLPDRTCSSVYGVFNG